MFEGCSITLWCSCFYVTGHSVYNWTEKHRRALKLIHWLPYGWFQMWLLGLETDWGRFILTWCSFSAHTVCITRCSPLLDRGPGQHHHEDPRAVHKSSSWEWWFIWKQEVSVPAAGVSSHHYTSIWFMINLRSHHCNAHHQSTINEQYRSLRWILPFSDLEVSQIGLLGQNLLLGSSVTSVFCVLV